MPVYFNFFRGALIAATVVAASFSAVHASQLSTNEERSVLSAESNQATAYTSMSATDAQAVLDQQMREDYGIVEPKVAFKSSVHGVWFAARLKCAWFLGETLRDALTTGVHAALPPALAVGLLTILHKYQPKGASQPKEMDKLKALPFIQSGLFLATPYLTTLFEAHPATAPYTKGALMAANIGVGFLDFIHGGLCYMEEKPKSQK